MCAFLFGVSFSLFFKDHSIVSVRQVCLGRQQWMQFFAISCRIFFMGKLFFLRFIWRLQRILLGGSARFDAQHPQDLDPCQV
mmetsp:Transcript_12303/g.24813  ORF Transcript_12303/g.24813 Transcript_12303/m.24813 type:complete len:82 (-) Transcript_12303:36-281(-)